MECVMVEGEKGSEVGSKGQDGILPRSKPTKPAYSIIIGSGGEVNKTIEVRARPPGPLSSDSRSSDARADAAGVAGEDYFYQRRFADAVREFQTAVRLAPENPRHHYRLAYCAWRANQLSLVERHARLAVNYDPKFASAHDLLGQWYLHNARYELALGHSKTACELAPDKADVTLSRAFVLAGSGNAKGAWTLLEPLMHNPMLAERVTILFLQIASRIGREREAADWALGYLSRSMFPPVERSQLLFTLANVLDRLGRYDEAIAQVRATRQLLHIPYDPAEHERGVTARIVSFSRTNMASLPRATHGDRRPVFIVGMPRSGTSLVEQILASHPDVYGAGELEDLLSIAAKVGGVDGQNYPHTLATLTPSILDQLAHAYLDRIDSLNSTSRFVTDKMPLNYLELGLIELLFPGTRIIHCVRDPRDTCLSCYMNDIAAGVTFARDQRTLAGYYRQYQRLMDHWQSVLSIPILEVRYEDVVGDLEGQARRLLQFMELPWDDRCLSFHQNIRGVATASREQVRQPLYASSVGRWKHYRAHLRELIEALDMQEVA
jgi:tetratricopeptide (TPR) repeat protein